MTAPRIPAVEVPAEDGGDKVVIYWEREYSTAFAPERLKLDFNPHRPMLNNMTLDEQRALAASGYKVLPDDCGPVRTVAPFFPLPGRREGRENRPQLRCGIASQTRFPPSLRRQPELRRAKANPRLTPGVKARARKSARRSRHGPAARHMRSPNIYPREAHAAGAIARTVRENFIAKMKREDGVLPHPAGCRLLSRVTARHPMKSFLRPLLAAASLTLCPLAASAQATATPRFIARP